MAKQRGPDGIPIDIPSTVQKPRRGFESETRIERELPADRTQGEGPNRSTLFPEEAPTKLGSAHRDMRGYAPRTGEYRPPTDFESMTEEVRTVIAGGERQFSGKRSDELERRPGDHSEPGAAGLVVGWLVVVDGPGTGSSVRIGSGQNSIGRGSKSRVRLNFGDHSISRNNHAVLTYDPRGNRFYIHQGQSVNLLYLGDDPVLSPTLLPSGSQITMGNTTLRFVAFCDDEFKWLDQKDSGK